MSDIDRQIAELAEPIASITNWREGYGEGMRGHILVSAGSRWIRRQHFESVGELGENRFNVSWKEPEPSTAFTEHVDASLRLIEKRWPGARIELSTLRNDRDFAVARLWADDFQTILGDASMPRVHEKGDDTPNPVACALALAVLSALKLDDAPRADSGGEA